MDVGVSQIGYATQYFGPGLHPPAEEKLKVRILTDARHLSKEERRNDPPKGPPVGLTPEEQKRVEELKKRDREVREHEQAHKTAGQGLLIQGPFYTYEVGPDKKRYAVSGEVTIDASEVPDDPEATIQKMHKVRHAALAPPEPSPKDRQEASEASSKESRARIELTAGERKSVRADKGEIVLASKIAAGDAYRRSVQGPGEGLLLNVTA